MLTHFGNIHVYMIEFPI